MAAVKAAAWAATAVSVAEWVLKAVVATVARAAAKAPAWVPIVAVMRQALDMALAWAPTVAGMKQEVAWAVTAAVTKQEWEPEAAPATETVMETARDMVRVTRDTRLVPATAPGMATDPGRVPALRDTGPLTTRASIPDT